MNKGSVHQEHLTVTNVNAPNTTERAKGDIDKFTVLAGKFNSAFSVIHRTSRQKMSRDVET